MNDRFRGRRSGEEKSYLYYHYPSAFIRLFCSEAKQKAEAIILPHILLTEFETNRDSKTGRVRGSTCIKIHSKSPTALETVINNIIRDGKDMKMNMKKFIGPGLCCR